MENITCGVCGKIFLIHPYEKQIRKYCSRECYFVWRKNFYKPSSECKEKISKSLIGNKYRVGHKPWIAGKKNIWAFGEKNVQWKGDDVGYSGLHYRIRRYKGKPTACEFCGKKYEKPRSIHLCNKSGKYLTDVSDWLYLCGSCHRIFDLSLGRGKRGVKHCFSVRK